MGRFLVLSRCIALTMSVCMFQTWLVGVCELTFKVFPFPVLPAGHPRVSLRGRGRRGGWTALLLGQVVG